MDPTFRYKNYPVFREIESRIMCVSLGVHVEGAANFWPDTTNTQGAKMGVMKRIATRMPDIDIDLFVEFRDFGREFMIRNMQSCILTVDTDLDVSTWLELTNYCRSRKTELLKLSETRRFATSKDFDIDCHIKFESYVEAKQFRGIYSRKDFFKTIYGPLIMAIGKLFFKLKWFVKHLDTDAKIERMLRLFGGPFRKLFTNDFSAFESTFVKLLMVIEVEFILFCCQCLPQFYLYMYILMQTKFGYNKMRFREFVVWLVAKRYSGEMDTSLCNSFVNLLFICFLLFKAGHDWSFFEDHFPPQIEGDDSIGVYVYPLDPTLLRRLGANAKFEFFDSINDASFCGMIFADGESCVLRDPISYLLDFGYANYRYLNSSERVLDLLLRAKSLSLLYTYYGCPILRELALYGLRVTRQIAFRSTLLRYLKLDDADEWHRGKYLSMLSSNFSKQLEWAVTDSARHMVFLRYGISFDDQITIEKYICSLTTKTILSHDLILDLAGSDRSDYYANHCIRHFVPLR